MQATGNRKSRKFRKSLVFAMMSLTIWSAGCVQAQSNVSFGEGLVMHSCAPYDGAALEARIPISSENRVAIVRINDRLRSFPLSRSITGIGKPGGASVQVCEKESDDLRYPSMPQIKYVTCIDSKHGIVNLDGLHGSNISGKIDVKLNDGQQIRGDFRLKLLDLSNNRVCG